VKCRRSGIQLILEQADREPGALNLMQSGKVSGMRTDPLTDTARGRDDATPARALTGVTLVISVVAALLIVALLIVWYALK